MNIFNSSCIVVGWLDLGVTRKVRRIYSTVFLLLILCLCHNTWFLLGFIINSISYTVLYFSIFMVCSFTGSWGCASDFFCNTGLWAFAASGYDPSAVWETLPPSCCTYSILSLTAQTLSATGKKIQEGKVNCIQNECLLRRLLLLRWKRNLPIFMTPNSSLLCSQEPSSLMSDSKLCLSFSWTQVFISY